MSVSIRKGTSQLWTQSIADGDGQVVKRAEQNLNISGSVATTYYARSSILGNQVQGELSGGAWKRAYVYLGTEKLIIQESGQTRWVHTDAVTKSQRATDSSGTVVSIIDLDPFGRETSRSNNAQVISSLFISYERDANGGPYPCSDEA